MKVTVNRCEIVKNAIELSEYIGGKSSDYEQVRAITYDKPLLDKWVSQALTELGDVLDRLTNRIETDGDEVNYCLMGTVTRPQEVEQSMTRYASYSVLCHWLNLVLPTAVAPYEANRQRELTELVNLSYYRKMPK